MPVLRGVKLMLTHLGMSELRWPLEGGQPGVPPGHTAVAAGALYGPRMYLHIVFTVNTIMALQHPASAFSPQIQSWYPTPPPSNQFYFFFNLSFCQVAPCVV